MTSKHIETINRFLEKYDNYEAIDDDDIEEFIESGLIRYLNEQEIINDMISSLIEEILVLFPEKELKKLEGTEFHNILNRLIKITADEQRH